MKVINNLNVVKTCQVNDITTKFIKIKIFLLISLQTTSITVLLIVNFLMNQNTLIPVHKNNEKCNKINYRPVSILTNISKIYEKFMYGQLLKYFDSLLATNQCGFRKGFRSQYCLLVMLERFKEAIEEISLGHFNQPFESI